VVAANNLSTLEEVVNYTKAGGACTSCHEKIEWVLDECLAETASNETAYTSDVEILPVDSTTGPTASETASQTGSVKSQLTVLKRIKIVESVLDEVRPGIIADGGNIELIDIEDDLVFVSMSGSCTSCSLSGLTINTIETKLSQQLGTHITVFPVQKHQHKKEATHDA